MKIIKDKIVQVLHIEYDMEPKSEREEVFETLDNRFGEGKYFIKRSGLNPKNGKGLIIVEVDKDE